MANYERYGTKEYWETEIKNSEIEHDILVNALENLARKDNFYYKLVDVIADRISLTNCTLERAKEELEKLKGGEDDN